MGAIGEERIEVVPLEIPEVIPQEIPNRVDIPDRYIEPETPAKVENPEREKVST